jgi:hypothetical protein
MNRERDSATGGEALPRPENPQLQTLLALVKHAAGAVNPDGSLRPEGWLVLLQVHGLSLTDFAREMGVSTSHIGMVVRQQRRNRRVEDALAERFGLDANTAWGRK